MKNDKGKKEEIIKIALDIVEKEGIDSLTVRNISSVGNINIALVNYYFGSKDNLLGGVLREMFEKKFRQIFSILDDKSIEPKERLKTFFLKVRQFILKKQENFNTFMLKNGIVDNAKMDMQNFAREIGTVKLANVISEITKSKDEKKLKYMTIHFMSIMIAPTIMVCKSGYNEMLKEDEINDYIDTFIENYF